MRELFLRATVWHRLESPCHFLRALTVCVGLRHFADMNASLDAPNTLLQRITISQEVCHRKPAIRGLRYPVEAILEYIAGGDTFEEVLAEFPDLVRGDLQACIQFAAQSLKVRSWQLVAA